MAPPTRHRGIIIDASRVLGQAEGPSEVSYNSRDLLIYALGIGCVRKKIAKDIGSDPVDELRFLYEDHDDGFHAFPTYPLVLPYKGTSSDVVAFPGPTLHLVPDGLRSIVDPLSILHYDQSLDIIWPLEPKGALLETRSEVVGLYQRRGGVLVRTKSTLAAGDGRILSVSTQGTFMRGLQINGDAGPELPPRVPRPSTPPDVVSEVTVSSEQALLYRLSGDYNPLHADPEAARAAGLSGTILHGLCTLGIATRQVLLNFSPAEPSALRHVSCRFSRTIQPGEALEVRMWTTPPHPIDPTTRCKSFDRTVGTTSASTAVRTGREVFGQIVKFEVYAAEEGGAVIVGDGKAVLQVNEAGATFDGSRIRSKL